MSGLPNFRKTALSISKASSAEVRNQNSRKEVVMMKVFSLLVAMLCISFASSVALAQDLSTTGSIGGKVADVNGAALAGATVTVTGPTGERSATTNDEGTFEVQNLNPGDYSLKATENGFKTALVSKVTVYVGKQSNLQLTLQPGEISATVDITDTATSIDQQ